MLLTRRSRVRTFPKGSERKRVGNSEGCVNQRVREFFAQAHPRRPEIGVFLSGPQFALSKWRVFVRATEYGQVLRGKAINDERRVGVLRGVFCQLVGRRKW